MKEKTKVFIHTRRCVRLNRMVGELQGSEKERMKELLMAMGICV
jgi:hypothetical protein